MMRCLLCSSWLTWDERFHYENTCEKCEQEEQERVDAWLNGALDSELDRRYGNAPIVKH